MSDDIPEPERTVTVEKAHLLRAQIEHAEEQAEDTDDINETYHNLRKQFTEERIEQIESDGISESQIEEEMERLKDDIESTEPDTDERLEVEAEFDTLRQIHARYFGGGPDVVEVAVRRVTGYDNGNVEFQDGSGKALVTFDSEMDARAAADCILDSNGVEDEAATVGMR